MNTPRFLIALALALPLGAFAQSAERLDNLVEAAAKCIDKEPMAPSMAAYRLLLSSHVVVKTRSGPLTMYVSPMDAKGGAKVWNLNPTRVIAIEKSGLKTALIGSLYSADYPLDDQALVGAFQGGLRRNIKLAPFKAPLWTAAGLTSASISTEPVHQSKHLLFGHLADGDRVLICATLPELEAFTK